MTVRDRDTLRKYFLDGRMPTGAHFDELISSMLNMQDEGFEKNPVDGLKISTAVSAHTLITFFRAENARQGLWSVRYGGAGDPLVVQPVPLPRLGELGGGGKPDAPAAPTLLSLHREGLVGVGKADPRYRLDVDGMVASRGRVGTHPVPKPHEILTDGGWHAVTGELHGCTALEVVASASAEGTGRHAMLHAVALNAHNPEFAGLLGWLARRFPWIDRRFNRRKRIRCQTAWFGERCDRLELQWAGEGGGKPYRLEIRTRCAYPGKNPIQLHVTQLWPAAPQGEPKAPAGSEPVS